MYSGNAYPSFLSTAGKNIDQEQLQVSTNVDAQAFGRYTNNPMAVNTHFQPLRYGDFSNVRMDSHTPMNFDAWINYIRPQSDLANSYSSGDQPPSVGDVRQMVVSEPSGNNQMSSDGQPPSVNDVRRREPSQSEASCNRYEGPDELEVQQVIISELNEGVYKIGAVGGSNDISAYSGYDKLKQDPAPVPLFGSKVSQSFGDPRMAFNSFNSTGLLTGGAWAPSSPQPQRMRTYTKVHKRGAFTRAIDIMAYKGYHELKQNLAQMFGIEGQLDDQQRIGWKLVYVDYQNDVLLVGEDPWEEFVNCVRSIRILSPQEVQQMSLD